MLFLLTLAGAFSPFPKRILDTAEWAWIPDRVDIPSQSASLLHPSSPLPARYETTELAIFNDGSTVTPPFDMPTIVQPVFPDRTCDISSYGSVDGGIVKNTKAIDDAISDCAKQGGGHVVIPKGTWLTGAVHLQDNIDLHLEPDASLVFSPDPNDYLPVVLSRYEGIDVYNYSPLVYAYGKQNIAITGKGKLVGNGKNWEGLGDLGVTHDLYAMGASGVPVPERVFGSTEKMLRPSFVEFLNSRYILLEDFSIDGGPMWTLHPTYSRDIVVRNVSVITDGQNNDGLDIDSSQNVLVENSLFNTNDDAIAIKSGKAQDGLKVGIPTENVIIRNNVVEGGHGGIAIGSEIAGGVHNVFGYDCTMRGIQYGIRLKALATEQVSASDLWFRNIIADKVLFDTIQMTMHYGSDQAEGEPTGVPVFKNIYFSGITSPRTRGSIELDALESSPIQNVTIENTDITAGTGATMNNVIDITLKSVSIKPKYEPLFTITNGRNVFIDPLPCTAPMKICATIDGALTESVSLKPKTGSLPQKKIRIGADVPDGQVTY